YSIRSRDGHARRPALHRGKKRVLFTRIDTDKRQMGHGLSSWHTRSCVLTSYSVGSARLSRLDFWASGDYYSSILIFGGTIHHALKHSEGVAKRNELCLQL